MVINTVDTFIQSERISIPTNPEQKLRFMKSIGDEFYSEVARRMPRIINVLMIDGPQNQFENGLLIAYRGHCMNPRFVEILKMYINAECSTTDKHIIGAFLISVADKYFASHPVKDDKKTDSTKEKAEIAQKIVHVTNTAMELLSDYMEALDVISPGFEPSERAAIAAALSFENEITIKELVKSDLPVTSEVFKVYPHSDRIMIAALKLKKKEFTKLSKNGEAFIESVKKFVFSKLNNVEPAVCFRFLTDHVYRSISFDTNEYLLCITDSLQSEYPSLYEVAKEFKIKKA